MNPLPGDIFARRLRQERERLQMSQAALAKRVADILGINVDPSAITRIEQQTRTIRLEEAAAIAEVLGVPLTLLLADAPTEELEAKFAEHLAMFDIAKQQWLSAQQEMLHQLEILHSLRPIAPDLPELPGAEPSVLTE